METRPFDLNIEEILDNWDTKDALREIIANALDEQLLTNTEDIGIFKDDKNRWHIRDFGRGLRIDNFTQNENPEKKDHPHTIGKFGIGLKDAVATFDRKRVGVSIQSAHSDFTFGKYPKAGHEGIITLHAIPAAPKDSKFIGTEFIFDNCPDSDMNAAMNLFLKFSEDILLEETVFGHVLEKRGTVGNIYINGVKVATEDNFLFSYNITSLNKKIKDALSRERSNVGRTAYTDRVKAILLNCKENMVTSRLVDDIQMITDGVAHDEIRWNDVAIHACKMLQSSEKVVFMTAQDLTDNTYMMDEAKRSGHKIVVIDDDLRDKMKKDGAVDDCGNPIRDISQLTKEYNDSFDFEFIDVAELSPSERSVFDKADKLFNLIGGKPSRIKNVLISERMSKDDNTFSECEGIWESSIRSIIIKRTVLRNEELFAGTLLHEAAHAISGADDTEIEFELALTKLLGKVASHSLSERNNEGNKKVKILSVGNLRSILNR